MRYVITSICVFAFALNVQFAAAQNRAQDYKRDVYASNRGKASSALFDRLFEKESKIEVMIQFAAEPVTTFLGRATEVTPAERAAQLSELAREISAKRERATGRHAVRLSILQSYDHLPYVHAEVRDVADLPTLFNDPDIVMIEPVLYLRPQLASSLPGSGQRYSVGATSLSGQNRAIAIIDTGVDFTQPEFGTCTAAPNGWQPQITANCRIKGSFEFGVGDNIADDAPNRHGTNVAAIAASVAPGADIIVLDTYTNGRSSSADTIAAFNWLITNQASFRIVAVNMSTAVSRDLDSDNFNMMGVFLGDGDVDADGTGDTGYDTASCPTAFNAGMAALRTSGILPIVSSGNEGFAGVGVDFPACDPSAFVVGATYDGNVGAAAGPFATVNTAVVTPPALGFNPTPGGCTDNAPQQTGQVTCFSNSDNRVDLLAPGGNITAGGVTLSGTSQAAPHAAGVAALIAQAANFPQTPTANQVAGIERSFWDTTDDIEDPKWPGNSMVTMNITDALIHASVWKGIVMSQPGASWYVSADAKWDSYWLPIAMAHRLYGTNTGSYDAAKLDVMIKTPLLASAAY